MKTPQDVIKTPDGFRFDGEAAAMVSELATLLGVSPEIAVGMAVHDRLIALRRAAPQGDNDA
ncbi:hypothetical protein AAFN86_00525 [Roseomonas sp. CAU 1739]|uniref:hypothetical protein n=1 Tax=Roseomonas sp. CAU 1739 TaxID=3140364 RepID=UPI00325B306B